LFKKKKNRSKEKDRQDKKGDTDGFQKSTVRGLQNPAKVNPASTVGIDPIASNPGGVSKLPEEKEKSKGEKAVFRRRWRSFGSSHTKVSYSYRRCVGQLRRPIQSGQLQA
jgi:hypothetical protein